MMPRCAPALFCGTGIMAALSGCLLFKAAQATGELAATTVIVAGKTTTAAVKATGKVAASAITSSGSLTATSIESLAKLAQAGMVTFVDVATGAIVRVPWTQGMTLHAGGAAARLAVVQRAVAVVRNGRLVYSATRQLAADPVLEAGDVIRLAARVVNSRN